MAEIVFEKDFKFDMPAAGLNIYRLRRPDVSQETVRRAGSRFGLRAAGDTGSLVLNYREISYADPSAWGLRQFRRSGGWQYRHGTRWQATGPGHLKIENHEAARLALDALERFGLPTAPELGPALVQRLHVAHAERGGANHEERIVGVRVFYRRIVDGLPVEGPGGRTVVYLDHDRQLSGIDHLWHDIESVHEPVRGLRPVGEVIEEVRRRYGTGTGRVEVTDLRLGHFELGWDDDQEFLQPAYVATIRTETPGTQVRMNATVPVAAAVNAVGPIEPVRPAAVRQMRRAG
jgi:hypothetical protein